MNSFIKLQSDIMTHAGLSRQSATSFYELECPVCASQGKKRQGGFKLETDKIIFNCFSASCEAQCVFEEGQPISKRFRNLMSIFGVVIPADLRVKRTSIQQQIERELANDLYEKHTYKHMDIPDGWVPLTERNEYWIQYFTDRRCNIEDVLYIGDGVYRGSAAIPMKYYNKIIGFQIATLNGTAKYITHTDGNDHLLMINDGHINGDVILVEGLLDALCFPSAVGILNGRISKQQAFHLFGKRVSCIPDRHSGEKLLKQAKRYEWKVVIPPWRNVEDLNDCVVKYGKIATAKMIVDNTYEDYIKAEIAYKLWQVPQYQ